MSQRTDRRLRRLAVPEALGDLRPQRDARARAAGGARRALPTGAGTRILDAAGRGGLRRADGRDQAASRAMVAAQWHWSGAGRAATCRPGRRPLATAAPRSSCCERWSWSRRLRPSPGGSRRSAWITSMPTGRPIPRSRPGRPAAHRADVQFHRPCPRHLCRTSDARSRSCATRRSRHDLRLQPAPAGRTGTDRLADRVEVIHCGVDPSVFGPRDALAATVRAPMAPRAAPLRVVTVATLQRQKGHASSSRRPPPGRAWRAGPSTVRRRRRGAGLPRRRDRGGGPRRLRRARGTAAARPVAATGGRRRRGPAEHRPARSGKTEGIPVALMEAMASGAPVVATRVSGVPELVEDGVTGGCRRATPRPWPTPSSRSGRTRTPRRGWRPPVGLACSPTSTSRRTRAASRHGSSRRPRSGTRVADLAPTDAVITPDASDPSDRP